MKLSLVVIAPHNHEGEHIRVRRSPFLIGREAGCHWRAKTPSLDARHCALLIRGDKVFLASFAENLTLVNDVQVQGEVEAHDRDCVKAGCLTFTIQIENAPVQAPKVTAPAASMDADEEAVATFLLAKEVDDEEKGSGSNPSSRNPTVAPRHVQRDEASKLAKAKPSSPESPDTGAIARNLLRNRPKPVAHKLRGR